MNSQIPMSKPISPLHVPVVTPVAHIDFANTLRGFAAIAVMISHYTDIFWTKRALVSHLTNMPLLSMDIYPTPILVLDSHFSLLSDWGSFGVALFFLISGFVIPFSLPQTTWLEFLAHRIFRIFPIYGIGFSLTLFMIWLGGTLYSSNPWLFQFHEILIHYVPGLRDVFGTRNIDGVIWTLEIEMKFYLMIILTMPWFQKKSAKVFLIPAVLFIITMWLNFLFITDENLSDDILEKMKTFAYVSQYMIFIYIGVVYHYFYINKLSPEKILLLIFGLFTLFCIEWQLGPYQGSFSKNAWNYGLALLVFTFAYAYPKLFCENRVFRFLAQVSYPLYVVHGVSGFIFVRLLMEYQIPTGLCFLIVTLIMVGIAWALHKWVEEPMRQWSKNWTQSWSASKGKTYIERSKKLN